MAKGRCLAVHVSAGAVWLKAALVTPVASPKPLTLNPPHAPAWCLQLRAWARAACKYQGHCGHTC